MSTSGNTAWYFLKHYKKSSKFLQTSNKPSNLPPWNSFSKRTYAYSKRQIYIKTTKIDPELRQIVLSSNNSLSNSSNCLGCLPKYCNILVAELVEKRHYYPCPLKYKLNCVWSTRDLERAVPVARPELLVPMKLRSGPEKELKREQPLHSTRLLPNFWNVLKKKIKPCMTQSSCKLPLPLPVAIFTLRFEITVRKTCTNAVCPFTYKSPPICH